MFKFLRRDEICERRGVSKSTLNREIQSGLFTEPVLIGARAKAWPDNEVTSINQARLAGYSDEQIREVVKALHAMRPTQIDLFEDLPEEN